MNILRCIVLCAKNIHLFKSDLTKFFALLHVPIVFVQYEYGVCIRIDVRLLLILLRQNFKAAKYLESLLESYNC